MLHAGTPPQLKENENKKNKNNNNVNIKLRKKESQSKEAMKRTCKLPYSLFCND